MGAQSSKNTKDNEDIINVSPKKAEAKGKTDFKHGNSNDLTGNPSNTASINEELGPAQLTKVQMGPGDGNEVVLKGMHQVSAADVQEQRTDNADRVKLSPYCPCPVRVTHQQTLLQQATARPTTGHIDVNKTAGTSDVLSDTLQLIYPVLVPQNTKCRAPEQQQTDRQVIYSHTRPEESRNFTPSQQTPAAMETKDIETVREVSDTVHNCKAFASVQLPAQMFCKATSLQEECRRVELFVCIHISIFC